MIALKNQNKEAKGTAINLISAITKIKSCIKSITFDQGSEFKKYVWIKSCIGAQIYFCVLSSLYQKRGIGNGNSIIWLEFQRTHDTEKLKQKDIEKVINKIIHRPFKCLNYLTPIEAFQIQVYGLEKVEINYSSYC